MRPNLLKSVAALLVALTPLAANAAEPVRPLSAAERAMPWLLSVAERAAYRAAFLDAAAGRLSAAETAIASYPASPLADALRAELLLARDGAPVEALTDWLSRNHDAPQAARLVAAAKAKGAASVPVLPAARAMRVVSYNSPMAPRSAGARGGLNHKLNLDQPAAAEAAWRAAADEPTTRTETAQRIAWAYYTSGDDAGAQRLGLDAGEGDGEWAALGRWTAGLAAWRAGDCERAAAAFDGVAAKDPHRELASAAAFWASRAHMACGRPQLVAQRLGLAARDGDGFYGLLARRSLGQDIARPADWAEPDFIQADWTSLSKLPGARRAAALVEVGQLGLADRELRHLAATGDPTNHDALLRLASRLNMPATQYWLAHRPPSGAVSRLSARFPAPDWRPNRGWRVDRALVFAHALQESNFVTDAVSHAGARGLMQLMPGTARDVSKSMGVVAADLTDPAFNIECGQTYLEALRDSTWTGGLLPKVVAAYNAGPGSVQKWNASLRDNGDPLLFIESIPFVETRHYVEVVMRNYWMYQQQMGLPNTSIDAIAQGLWPKFPGMPGATAVRMDGVRTLASAD